MHGLNWQLIWIKPAEKNTIQYLEAFRNRVDLSFTQAMNTVYCILYVKFCF